jgi:hypothetical protein
MNRSLHTDPVPKPLVYGYIRVQSDWSEDELLDLERDLQRFAVANGFSFAGFFHETMKGYYGVFHELVLELQRVRCRHVVVSSIDDLAGHHLLQIHLLRQLEIDAGAEVLELSES